MAKKTTTKSDLEEKVTPTPVEEVVTNEVTEEIVSNPVDESTEKVATHLATHNGLEIVTPIEDVENNGVVYKRFTVSNGQTFMVRPEELK